MSNANDALEKLRLTALTDKQAWDGSEPLNITIKAIKDEDGPGGRIVISGKSLPDEYLQYPYGVLDTGIGMGPEELSTNLVCAVILLHVLSLWFSNACTRAHWQNLARQNFFSRPKALMARELAT